MISLTTNAVKKAILNATCRVRFLYDSHGQLMGDGKQHISDSLRRFLKEKIQTVLRLEILLLLHNQQPRALTAPEVANRLGFEKDTTAHELRQLEAIGVLVQSKSDKTKYRYQPPNETLRSLIEQLALDYSKHRISILSAMLAEHPDRTRLFTQAFKIISRND